MFPDLFCPAKSLFFHRAIFLLIVTLLGGSPEAHGEELLDNPIACRFASYGDYQDAAWEHLPSIGVKYVFLNVPKPDEVETTLQKLSDHDLTPLVMRGETKLSEATSVQELGEQCAICERMGVKYMFLSPKRHDAPKEIVYERLRQAGDLAKEHGVTITLETHPDLGTNGDVHLETMKAIDHPNIRVNFDTANITYYNKETDACTELKKIVPYVATFELKDHNLEYETWNFPVLGEGKVDFKCVLEVLRANGYTGPITLEFEGIEGIQLSREETLAAIAKSVEYTRALISPPAKKTATLHPADHFMLIGYFVLMLGIGLYFYRYMKGMKDYFSGGNNIPWWLSGVSFYMSSFSVYSFIAYPALCYKYGCVGITLLWVAVPAVIFGILLFAKKWRRARIDSPVEYLEIRYSPLLRQLFAWQGVPVKMVDDGLKLVSIGTFISVGLGFPMTESMLGAGLIMLVYTMMGGLWAVAVTDFVQFVVLTVAILIVLPLSISRAGGWDSFIENTPASFFSFTNDEYGWIYVGLLALLYCLAWSSINWSLIQRYYCVPNEKEAVKAGWLVTVLYILGPPIMFLPAIAARQFLGEVPDKEVYPLLCVELLPAGMLGLVIAAMFSATMSMLSSDYNVCASVLTNDVYKRYIRPQSSEKELVLVGRLATLIIGIVALGVAFLMSGGSGETLFRTMVTLFGIATAPVAVPMLLGLLSKKVHSLGALWGFVFGLGSGLLLFFLFPKDRDTEILGIGWDHAKSVLLVGDYVWRMEIVLFMATALVTLIVLLLVSALTPMKESERENIESFHRRLQTPIGEMVEDRMAEGAEIFSPFRVVGVSIFLIGLMMLVLLPWMYGSDAFGLDLFFGLFLTITGGIVWRRSGKL